LPIVIILIQDTLLSPLLEFEDHVLLSDAEANFSSFYVDPCPGGPQEWSPKNELDSEVALYIHYQKVGKDEGVSHAD